MTDWLSRLPRHCRGLTGAGRPVPAGLRDALYRIAARVGAGAGVGCCSRASFYRTPHDQHIASTGLSCVALCVFLIAQPNSPATTASSPPSCAPRFSAMRRRDRGSDFGVGRELLSILMVRELLRTQCVGPAIPRRPGIGGWVMEEDMAAKDKIADGMASAGRTGWQTRHRASGERARGQQAQISHRKGRR